MIHGLDTGFLVAAEVQEHVEHVAARVTLARLLTSGDLIAVAPQVLAEFMRKWLLDTLLTATYCQAGLHSLLTTNPGDFGILGVFACIPPALPGSSP